MEQRAPHAATAAQPGSPPIVAQRTEERPREDEPEEAPNDAQPHIFRMTDGVDDILKTLQKSADWAQGIGRDPAKVHAGDIVFLLGHGGGQSTKQFIDKWIGLHEILKGKIGGLAFVLLMCNTKADAAAQTAELVKKDGAAKVIYYQGDQLITLYLLDDFRGALRVEKFWHELFLKDDGEEWSAPGMARKWQCL